MSGHRKIIFHGGGEFIGIYIYIYIYIKPQEKKYPMIIWGGYDSLHDSKRLGTTI